MGKHGSRSDRELAEWAAEWLGKIPVNIVSLIPLDSYHLFESESTAPILAALAKRKMEELGFFVSITNSMNESGEHNGYSCLIRPWSNGSSIRINNENEYIALWLAVRSAIDVNAVKA